MNAGTRIVRSCELVENIWMQINEFGNSLIAMIGTALENGEFENYRSAGQWNQTWDETESRWCSTAYAMSFPVMEKRRRKLAVDAWINFQVSVFGSGIPPLEDGGQASIGPVVHVSFWHARTDFEEPGLSIVFSGDQDEYLELRDNRLLFWKSQRNGEQPQWTFSIRLLDLHDEDALRTSLIEPIRALLTGARAEVALPESLPGLISYKREGHGNLGFRLLASIAIGGAL
jgi:hypothetical protein